MVKCMSKNKNKQQKTAAKEKISPKEKSIYTVIAAVEAFLFIFGILDVSGALKLFPFGGVVFFLFVASIPIVIMYFLSK